DVEVDRPALVPSPDPDRAHHRDHPTVTSSVRICVTPLWHPVRGSPPPGLGGRFWCHRPPPPRGGLLRPRTPRRSLSLPAVVAHERHRGGNSTPLDIPVDDGSGPVTEVTSGVGVAVHQAETHTS